jgi:hypothetical protein
MRIQDITDRNELIKYFVENNITMNLVPELNSINSSVAISDTYRKCFEKVTIDSITKSEATLTKCVIDNFAIISLTKEGFEFDVKFSVKLNKYSEYEIITSPKIGRLIKRVSKDLPNGIILKREDVINELTTFKNAIEDKKKIARIISTVNLLLNIRKTDLIDFSKLDSIQLSIDYNASKDPKQFLIDNGFSGIENYGIYTSKDDGYGHKCGQCTSINFENKTIYVSGYSSDD